MTRNSDAPDIARAQLAALDDKLESSEHRMELLTASAALLTRTIADVAAELAKIEDRLDAIAGRVALIGLAGRQAQRGEDRVYRKRGAGGGA